MRRPDGSLDFGVVGPVRRKALLWESHQGCGIGLLCAMGSGRRSGKAVALQIQALISKEVFPLTASNQDPVEMVETDIKHDNATGSQQL
nr:unnamed protein product [Digitaria exilis]